MKKNILFIFVLVILMCNNITVYATVNQDKPTKNEEKNCIVYFRVGYIQNSENTFNDDIAVVLTDTSTETTYQFLLKSDENYGAGKEYRILANCTYEIKLTYPNADKFEIINADGTEIKSVFAPEYGFDFVWQIKAKTNTEKDEINSVDNAPISTNNDLSAVEELNAEELISEYIEKTKFIENNNDFKIFISNWSGAIYKKLYLEESGNSAEDWENMTPYQRSCYSLLFLLPKSFILGTNNSIYATDQYTFIKNLEVVEIPLNKINKGSDIYKAIVTVWNWHWYNWETTGIFINPFEGNTFDLKDRKESIEDFVLSSEDMEDIKNDITTKPKETEASENIRSQLANPKNFLSIIKDNIISIIILIIVAIILFFIVRYNRKKNYDKEDGD